MNQRALDFSPDDDKAGFRLHEVSVYNWGSFHGKVHTFSPEGRTAILTGQNGTGKSTLADALLTLLVPHKHRNYNQAGNAKNRERSEREYVLGTYSEKHDEATGFANAQHLRGSGAYYTVLLAHFHNADLHESVTLAQVIWQNTTNKLERRYFVEPRRLTIEGDFGNLGSPSEIDARLKQRGLTDLDSFPKYASAFHKRLHLEEKNNPMEIFNQAICVKDISDLTTFIRNYMLDDGGAFDLLKTLRSNFVDLRATDARIKLATKQRDALDLIKNDHDALAVLSSTRDELTRLAQIVPPFMAEKEVGLREQHGATLATQKAMKEADKLAIELRMQRLAERISSIDATLQSSEAGRRLEELQRERDRRSDDVVEKRTKRAAFDGVAKAWSAGARVFDASSFGALQQSVTSDLPGLRQRLREIDEAEMPALREAKVQAEARVRGLEAEHRSLLARSTNIPDEALRARDFIVKGLGLRADDLPFVGEILQVRESEAQWTGAIERLLHSFALRMVVRPDLSERVDAFVNQQRQRGLVTYDAIPKAFAGTPRAARAHSVASKLEVKGGLGVITTWLTEETNHRFEHACCADTSDPRFLSAANALTLDGLIKSGGTTRRKDDRRDLRDVTQYVLGWDNRDKLKAVKARLDEQEQILQQADSALARLRESRAGLTERVNAADKLQAIYSRFEDIDWESVSRRITEIDTEMATIRKGSQQLKELQDERAKAAADLKAANAQKEKLVGDIAVLVSRLEQNLTALAVARQLVATCDQASAGGVLADFRSAYPTLEQKLSLPVTTVDDLAGARDHLKSVIQSDLAKVNKSYGDRSSAIRHRMGNFAQDPENVEFKDQLAGDYIVPGYSPDLYRPFETVLRYLIEQDLPKNRTRFETLLHTTVTDGVDNFGRVLDAHKRLISARIKELNTPLQHITFDRAANTFVRLVATHTEDQDVKEFRALHRHALQDSLHADDKELLKERYLRVQQLLDRLEKDEQWTRKVIDVRNWFTFRADEIYRETGALKQSYSGSLKKSAGEKSRLASTILATGIAYQYGLSVGDQKTESFRLVVVDEIFSGTDNVFSEYLLELFKEFHLQLLMIQPLDAKIYLVEKYAERYHVVTKNDVESTVRNLSVAQFNSLVHEEVLAGSN